MSEELVSASLEAISQSASVLAIRLLASPLPAI
jgi:hypothetical protein